MTFVKTIPVAIWLLMCSTTAHSNRYLDNPPRLVDLSVDRYLSPVGELETDYQANCSDGITCHRVGTGFLVSPCYILTAAHVVFGRLPTGLRDLVEAGFVGRDGTVINPQQSKMKFHIGKGANISFRGVTIATPVVSGTMSFGGIDWALMRLTSCVGQRSEFGWFQETRLLAAQMVGLRIAAIGYPADRNRGSMEQSIGTVTSTVRYGSELNYSASSSSGQSGGPIITVSNGRVEVIGIITGQISNADQTKPNEFSSYSEVNSNQFLSVGLVMNRPDVRMLIKQDRGTLQNPATPLLDEFK